MTTTETTTETDGTEVLATDPLGFGVDPADDDDLDFLPPKRRGIGMLTGTLLALLLAAGAFAGGVLAQKSHDKGLVGGGRGAGGAAARTGRAGAGAAGGTAGAGGFAGFGGTAAGTGTGTGTGAGAGLGAAGGTGTGTGTDAGGAAGDTGTGAAAGPAVVGTVVSSTATTLTVKNFGGKTITVTLGDGATVTRSTTVPLTGLKAGSTVSVTGTTGADGTVTATAVTGH